MSPKSHKHSRTEVSWKVYFFTPHAQIEGETVNISPEGALVSCRELPSAQGNFRVVIKPPDRQPLDITAALAWTTVIRSTDGTESLGADVHFVSIPEKDREYLLGSIATTYEEKICGEVNPQTISPEVEVAAEAGLNQAPHIADIQMPVFYNKGGKTIKAIGSRFSTKGCHLYTKLAPPKGAVFSLKLQNPRTGKSIQVDSSIVQCKRCAVKDHWGMILRFMNLNRTDREEILQILQDNASSPNPGKEPKYGMNTIRETILKHFKGKNPSNK
jgi:hypothetical protein